MGHTRIGSALIIRGYDVSNAIEGTISDQKRPVGFLALMHNRNYALLWSGQLVSEFGNRFQEIVVSLWIYSLTRSPVAVSLAISSMFVGGLLVGLFSGALVDRLNRKSILIAADLTRGVLITLIPSLMSVSVWLVYADLAIMSMATAFFRPAMLAVIPQIVSRRDLLPANSFYSAMDTGTEIIGPAAAGVLAYLYGYAPLLYIDGITFAVSAMCIWGMTIAKLPDGASHFSDLRAILQDVLEGLRYIRRDQLQYALFILILPATLVGGGLNALQTPLAKGILGITDAEFGTFKSVWGVGFVIASLVLGWYGSKLGKMMLILGGYGVYFMAAALMGLSTSFDGLLVTGFSAGFANTFYYVGISTLLMERTPQDMIGRVISTRQVAISTARVFSPLIFGLIANYIGVRNAVVTMAFIGAVGTTIVVVTKPAIRRYEHIWPELAAGRLAMWRMISSRVLDSFDESQQRRLNVVAISILLGSWMGLIYKVPFYALGLIFAVLAVALVATAVRTRGWWM